MKRHTKPSIIKIHSVQYLAVNIKKKKVFSKSESICLYSKPKREYKLKYL